MPTPSDQIEWLAHQFDALVARLKQSTSLEERMQLLRRMKILIDKIDAVILSAKQSAPSSPTPDRSTNEAH
jgi:hypothetical protein